MARTSFPLMISSDGYAELNVGKIRYPVRIRSIDHSTYETSFEGYVLSLAEQYTREDIANTKKLINSLFGSPKGVSIEKVIFNPPATIVLWSDGTKTVVKAQGYDEYDPEKGLAMAICKKVMGNKGNYNNEINKWTAQYWEKIEKSADSLYPTYNLNNQIESAHFNKVIEERMDKLLKKMKFTDERR